MSSAHRWALRCQGAVDHTLLALLVHTYKKIIELTSTKAKMLLVYWYKSTNTDAQGPGAGRGVPAEGPGEALEKVLSLLALLVHTYKN